ncbi:MAG: T9SS type A sorting domain-containing protein [Algibacter sp.]|uniref:T9SS type A sorting domain-containing protein n=1 Tax=Algibacter sp. TaxID=1872428 RepID=UPI00329735E6
MMKTFYSFLSVFFYFSMLFAQQTYVPDDNFEQALINLGYDNVLDNYVLTSNIDGITNLDVSNSRFSDDDIFGIQDLTGIEDFTALEELNCSINSLTSLDLSSNLALEYVFCEINDLTSINVCSNTALKWLICRSNNLISLNVTSNPALEVLICETNELTSLNVRSNHNLVRLRCGDNKLEFLNVKNGNNHNFDSDIVIGFDASGNPDLSCILVDDAAYSNANWSFKDDTAFYDEYCLLPSLTYIPDDNFEQALINLGYDDVLDNFVVSGNINNITNLDVSNSRFGNDDFGIINLTGIEDFTSLVSLDCSYSNITSLDLSSNGLLETLFCNVNDLKSLNVACTPNLKTLNCDSNELTQLNVSLNPKLELLYCVTNQLTSLDVSANTTLVRLRCADNELTYLNVKNGNNINFDSDVVLGFEATSNPNLTCIQVDDAAYSNANWSHKDDIANYNNSCFNPFLVYLPDNFFEQYFIDLGIDDILDDYVLLDKLIYIQKLDISNKNISDLTGIEYFTDLETLYCQNNKLTNLDLSLNTALTYLNCSDNQLEALNLKNGNNANFTYLNTTGNNGLMCIQVDNKDYSSNYWKSDGAKHFCIDKFTEFSESCESLGVHEISDISFRLYPNPISEKLTIHLQNGFELKKLSIYNHIGQLINQEMQNTMDVSKLSKGIYFIQVETNQGKSTKKILKE